MDKREKDGEQNSGTKVGKSLENRKGDKGRKGEDYEGQNRTEHRGKGNMGAERGTGQHKKAA